jgi:hypothetical protein
MQDQDFDGVPDIYDQCKNTPFLNQVDQTGCTTKILKLPEQTQTHGLTITIKNAYSTNQELISQKNQYNTQFKLTYYYQNWSYSLRSGYYLDTQHQRSTDTSLRIKKRIRISPKANIGLSASINLPTYDVIGNKTDYTLSGSFNYYASDAHSFFAGYGHTFIHDISSFAPTQDTNYFYLGTGYFMTNHLYMNLSYNYSQVKFTSLHPEHTLGTTIYYKINTKWFTTFSYHKKLDQHVHDSFSWTIGYIVW